MTSLKCGTVFRVPALALLGFIGVLTILFLVQGFGSVEGAIHYVDDDGGADYTTINHAMENATDGDTIMIHPGSYEETLEVNKELTFTSTTGDPEDVVIHKAGVQSIFSVYSNNVTISGLTVKYGTYMIFLHSSDNCLIENNIIMDGGSNGIRVDGTFEDGASNNTIRGNNITGIVQYGAQIGDEGGYNIIENNMFYNCGDGLWIYFTAFEIVRNNTIMNCDGQGLTIHQSNYCEITNNTIEGTTWIGLSMSYSSWNTLRENTISGSEYNIDFLGTATPDFEHDIDDSNTVDGRPIYYWMNRDNETVPTDAGFVGIVSSENITVKDLTLNHNGESILFVSTMYSLIDEVNCSFSEYGIHLFFSDHNTIVGGTVWENDKAGIYVKDSNHNTLNGIDASNGGYNFCDGIYIMDSDHTTVITCRVNENWGKGIMLISSSYCTVSMNEVNENTRSGIWLVTGTFNRIENNSASGNGDNGIYLGSSPKWNHIANNTCSGNGDNLNEAGINFESGTVNTAIHNTVSNNKASGFYFQYGSGNLITDNNVQSNTGRAGFYLSRFAVTNTISRNNVSNNQKGFELAQASGNVIDNNSIFNSRFNGILITDGDVNSIMGNFIVNTSEGYGIHLKSVCQQNQILNNYLDNDQNAFDDGTDNVWNTAKQAGTNIVDGPWLGGNYWGNYSGLDGDSDWIGDTPQAIDGGDNEDLLPLMLKPTLRTDFSWEPKNPLEGTEVQFTDKTTPGEFALTNWHWDFDDGSTSDEQNPMHTFDTAGTYEVMLDVLDSDGNSKQATKHVFVKLAGPLYAENVNTGERFGSIQEAVNDTDTLAGHVIEVDPGNHTENIIVWKEVTIRSISGDYNDTFLMPRERLDPVFTVIANRVTISGLTITQSGWTAGNEVGIYLNHSDESTVENNHILNHGAGITMTSCQHSVVQGNLLENNSNYAIFLASGIVMSHPSEYNTIQGNVIVGAGSTPLWEGVGIGMEYTDHSTISENELDGLSTGILLRASNSYNVIEENSIAFCLDEGIRIGTVAPFEGGNMGNHLINNTLRYIIGVSFSTTYNSHSNIIENMTIGSTYPTRISFTCRGTIDIHPQNQWVTDKHRTKENLGTFFKLGGGSLIDWIDLMVYYPEDWIPAIKESTIQLCSIETFGAEFPWFPLQEETGLNMDENYVRANITRWGEEPYDMIYPYGVFGSSVYDVDFGDSGYVNIDFGGTGDIDLDVEVEQNPGPDDDSLEIFVNITQIGTGDLEWLNITIDLSDNSFVDEGDDLLIYYWNETRERWVVVEHSGYDRDTGRVWANLSHLTVFAPRIVSDTSRPTIVHTPLTEIDGFPAMVIEAQIIDDREVQEAKVYVRKAGSDSWTEVPMLKSGGGGMYTATFHVNWLVDDLEYYIWATDGTNEVTSPANAQEPYLIEGEFGEGTDEGVEMVAIMFFVIIVIVVLVVIPIKTGMIGGSKERKGPMDPGQQLIQDIESLKKDPDQGKEVDRKPNEGNGPNERDAIDEEEQVGMGPDIDPEGKD